MMVASAGHLQQPLAADKAGRDSRMKDPADLLLGFDDTVLSDKTSCLGYLLCILTGAARSHWKMGMEGG